MFFLRDGPGGSYVPITSPYAETSPGVFVSVSAEPGTVRRFTTEQLEDAIEPRR